MANLLRKYFNKRWYLDGPDFPIIKERIVMTDFIHDVAEQMEILFDKIVITFSNQKMADELIQNWEKLRDGTKIEEFCDKLLKGDQPKTWETLLKL